MHNTVGVTSIFVQLFTLIKQRTVNSLMTSRICFF